MRFSRDGRRLVHWQADALQVRDAATLQPLGTLLRPFAQAPAGALLAIDDAWVADDGHTVTVSIDGAAAGTATANGSGDWTFTSSILADGAHGASATATDSVGNVSPASTMIVPFRSVRYTAAR